MDVGTLQVSSMKLLDMKRPTYSLNSFSGHSLSAFFLGVFLLLFKADALVKLPENVTIPAVFAFGDSIVDQGNNNRISTLIKCNFAPYGKDFPNGVATGRFSNARTPPDMIAEELGIKDLLPASLDPNLQAQDLLTGLSFASGGSGYDSQTSQLVLKASVGEEKANFIIANSLYLLVSGSDDLANTYFTIGIRRAQYDINSYTDLLAASASNFLKELYEVGARRVGVLGLPPIGCVPSQRTLSGGPLRSCAENENQAAQLLNGKISSAIDSLNPMLPQSKIVYMDIYNPLLDLILYPQNYGLEVVDRGCCGTGNIEVTILCNPMTPTCPDASKFLFWDSYHPTEKGYQLLVQQILQKYLNSFL